MFSSKVIVPYYLGYIEVAVPWCIGLLVVKDMAGITNGFEVGLGLGFRVGLGSC